VTIIVDNREKKPYWGKEECQHQRLNVGDYTTSALFGIYHIERKSLQDLYGTLTKGKIRFLNEIHRAKRSRIKLEIVVEGSELDFYNKKWPHGQMRDCPAETLKVRIWHIKRLGVSIHWCSTRAAAKHKVKSLLKSKESLFNG